MSAGAGAAAANGSAGTASAGSGGTRSMDASTASGGAQSTAGTMAAGGAAGTAVAGSGGSAGHASDSGVDRDAGKNDAGSDAAVSNPADCPTTYAELAAATSCSINAACAYPEGYCTCVGRCSGVAPAPGEPPVTERWSCSRPVDGCPLGIPTAGSACSDEGRTCNYGSCCIQLATCRSDRWTVGPRMCPP